MTDLLEQGQIIFWQYDKQSFGKVSKFVEMSLSFSDVPINWHRQFFLELTAIKYGGYLPILQI